MGLKYIEPIKSIVLLLLVLLSIAFTFSIWTYTPNYDPIEPTATVDTSIAKQLTIRELVKPYKVLVHSETALKGSMEEKEIDVFLNEMARWRVTEFAPAPQVMDQKNFNEFLSQPNRMTLYFQGTIPVPSYDAILNIEERNLPEAAFDRLVVEWTAENSFKIHFINHSTGDHYQGKVISDDFKRSFKVIAMNSKELPDFEKVGFNDNQYLAVPSQPLLLKEKTFFQQEVSPTRFRNALFNDPNAVRRSPVDSNHEEYGDNVAKMIVDTEKKTLNFVHPDAQYTEPIDPSELFKDVLDSINEHGGWTDSYRYSYMNSRSHYVKFQLFIDGLPVHSDSSEMTAITVNYGVNRIEQYSRPYYTLDELLTEDDVKLPSGVDIAETMNHANPTELKNVVDLTLGYSMRHDTERQLYIIEPGWFYLTKGKWTRFSPEQFGGESIGLE
ncbi:regulatory protein YycH of two-component signal transduction system YycFG [Sporosarcina luteola]|nr:regulatory protein YycH of two-component signal transduction system YycFG [Sporosarcina luteola]